jgi:hypothetical protein
MDAASGAGTTNPSFLNKLKKIENTNNKKEKI